MSNNCAAVAYKSIAVVIVGLLIGGCLGKQVTSPKPIANTKIAQQARIEERPKVKATMKRVTLRWEEGGKPRLVASARVAKGNELTGMGTLEDVSAELYKNGKKVAILQAPHVEADQKKKVLVATGGATIKSVEQKTIVRSPRMRWQADNHTLTGSGGITANSENGRVDAESFVADTDLRIIEFRAGSSGGRAFIGNKQDQRDRNIESK